MKLNRLEQRISRINQENYDNEAELRGDTPISYSEHLGELRIRLFFVLIFIVIFFALGLYLNNYIHDFLIEPVKAYKNLFLLKYDIMGESIIIQLKLALGFSLSVCIPIAVFQFWRFIRPAISPQNRMFIRLSLLFAVALFYTGAVFCFIVIIPFTIDMIIKFAHIYVQTNINMSSYFGFLILLSASVGIVFELPVAVSILTKLGIISPTLLVSKRKYAIVSIWIFSALVTPQDILTQAILAIPLMLLYEFSIFVSFLIFRKRRQTINK
ncbi:MAG TPA: twin-arginine translocase subunit TatC [Spirochaetota bacterium]|nr:twin-arginine translocase subunit TatC [Spirochaetota bacterium]